MKKIVILSLLVIFAAISVLASDAIKSINYSEKVMNSDKIEYHILAQKRLKAALDIPNITDEEIREIQVRIPKHEAKITALKEAAAKAEAEQQKKPTKPIGKKPGRQNTTNPSKKDDTTEQVILQPQVTPKRNAQLKVNKILFTNELRGEVINDETTPFYASDMRYLYAQVFYDGPSEETEQRVYVKLYDPQGNMKKYNDKDDFTFTQRFIFYPYDDMEDYLAGIGNAQKSIFTPGVYRYEVWADGKCIANKNLEIKLKPGETSVGTAEIKSVTINRKNFSVAFDVTLEAQNMPDTNLTTRISFYDAASGAPIRMAGGGNAYVERQDHILYDEAVLAVSMSFSYSKFGIPKGWSGSISCIAEILDQDGKVIANYNAGTFQHTQQ